MAFGGNRQGGGFRGGNRGGKKSNFVRVGSMFENDPQYTPQGAKFQYSTKLDGKYIDAVRDVLNNNDAVRFTLTHWNGDDNPVLSVAPITGEARRGSRNSGGRGSFGGGSQRSGNARFAGSRGREIEPAQDAPESDAGEGGDDQGDAPDNWNQ